MVIRVHGNTLMFLCFEAGRKVCIKTLIGLHILFNFSCGFYAVIRSVKIDCQAEDTGAADCWCYILNREVSVVTEDVVLAADESLLFYEKIEGPAG